MRSFQYVSVLALFLSMFLAPFEGRAGKDGEEQEGQTMVAKPAREPDFDRLYLRPAAFPDLNRNAFEKDKEFFYDALLNGSRMEKLFVGAQLACFSFSNLYGLLESKDGQVLANVCRAFFELSKVSEEEEAKLGSLLKYQSLKNLRKNATQKISGLAYKWCKELPYEEKAPEERPFFGVLKEIIEENSNDYQSKEIALNLYCTALKRYEQRVEICKWIEKRYFYSPTFFRANPFLDQIAYDLTTDPKSYALVSSMLEFEGNAIEERNYRLGAAAYAYVRLYEDPTFDFVCGTLTPLFGAKKFTRLAKEAIKGMTEVRKKNVLIDKARKDK